MANLRTDNLCGTGFVSANDGTVWSDYVTSTTGSTLSNYPATYGFDGNLSNFVYADNNSTMTWTAPNGGIKAGLIEVYVYAGNTHPLVRVNGVNTGAVVGSDLGQQGNWVDVTSLVDGHLKTIEADGYTISGTARSSGWSAVRINGEILVDGEQGTTGGRTAIDGSVFFSGYVDGVASDYLYLQDSDDLDMGTGDFTFECWTQAVEHAGNGDRAMGIFSSGAFTAGGLLIQNKNNGPLRVVIPLAAGGYFDEGGSTELWYGNWHHIAVVKTSNTIKAFINGVQEISATHSVGVDFAHGGYGTVGENCHVTYPGDYPYRGHISNLRLIKGTALYTANFTPPTEKLTAVDGTVLLCCQDTDDPTQEATGKHEIIGFRKCYEGKRYSNIATNGDLETGDTTGWTNGGCSTFEASTEVVHSGTYSLHCVSDGNGDHVYTTCLLYTSPSPRD